jgi:glycerophosphoryl diester phosphodiesterase
VNQVGNSAPAIAAHRGWHMDGAPENSIAALERAVRGGADRIELDVRRLGDKKRTLVVFHDAKLNGVPLDQLDETVLATHPHIATFEDWARRAGELDAFPLTEIKAPGYESEAISILRRHLPEEHLELMSFNHDAVREMARLVPHRPVGLLSEVQSPAVRGAKLVSDAQQLGATFLGLNVGQTQVPILDSAFRANLGVKVWTVNEPRDVTRLVADPRVDTVITDVPAAALKARDLARGTASSIVRELGFLGRHV